MFGGLAFHTKGELLTGVSGVSLIIILLLSVIHILWYGVRWYNDEVSTVSLFCQCILGQIAASSMFHKHNLVTMASQKTPSQVTGLSLYAELLATALFFEGLRLLIDKEALDLVSSIFFKLWMFGAILITPLIYEYCILPTSEDEDQLGPLTVSSRQTNNVSGGSRPPSYHTVEGERHW